MNLSRRVVDVLEEPAVRRINFQLGRLPVTSWQLGRVARKIGGNKIHIYLNASLGHAAEYVPARDSILLMDTTVFNSSYGKSCIVHEAVHAMADMNMATSTTLYSSEVSAYLAQMIYDEVASKRNSKFRFKALIRNPAGRIAREALKLIDKFDMTRKVVNLDWKDYHELREAIKDHPKYNWGDKQLFPADGVK